MRKDIKPEDCKLVAKYDMSIDDDDNFGTLDYYLYQPDNEIYCLAREYTTNGHEYYRTFYKIFNKNHQPLTLVEFIELAEKDEEIEMYS